MRRYVSRKSRNRRPMARKSSRKSYRKKSYKKGKNGTSGNTVTPQRDMRMQYQKSRMPSGKKRKWVSFVKKVKAVEESSRGLQRAIINDSLIANWVESPEVGTGIRRQGFSEVSLYSVNGLASGSRDKDIILDSSSNMAHIQDLTGVAAGVEKPTSVLLEETRIKVPMKRATIDITYTNDGPDGLELDLYVLKHRNIITPLLDPPINLRDAQIKWNTSQADKLYYPGAVLSQPGQNIQLDARGVTPFMCPGLSKFAGATIVNKTKVFLPNKGSVTRSYTDSNKFFIYSHDSSNNYRYDKDTISYLAIGKSTGQVDGATNTFVTSFTKTYSWTQEGVAQHRQTYFTSN